MDSSYLKVVTNPITNESSVASLDAQEGMNVQTGMWTQQLTGVVLTPHIVSPLTEGVSMNYDSGNQQQVYVSNANIIQMQTVPQGLNLFNLMPPDAGVACMKGSQSFHYVPQAIEQKMDNSVSASESMGSTQVSGTGSRSFSYITHVAEQEAGVACVKGSQSLHYVPQAIEQKMDNSVSASESMGSTQVSGTGSRSFSYITDVAEQEVDGMTQNFYPQQEAGWTKFLLDEMLSQPSADQHGKKDILQEAAQAVDLAVFDNELLPQEFIIDNSDTLNENTVGEVVPDVQLFSPVIKDDSNLSVYLPGSPSAKKVKCKRKPAKEVDGPSEAPASSKKLRLWEIKEPYENKEREKKRLDAIRAKKNRVRNKNGKLTLAQEFQAVAKERDALKEQVAKLAAQRKVLEMAVKERYTPTVKTIAGHEQASVIYIPYQTPLTLPSDISLPLSSPEQ